MYHILVIDDVDDVRLTIREMLERAGHRVSEAANGKEALLKIDQQLPDLVITDIFMPEMEGLEFIRTMKKKQKTLPIIALTGSSQAEYLQYALKFGAIYGLYKPFSQDELLIAVDAAFNKF